MNGVSRMLTVSALAIALAGCGAQGPPPSRAARAQAPAPAAFDYETRLGVAGRDGSGRLCLAIPDSSLSAGARVTLISTADPQSAVEARIVARRATPWEMGNMALEGASYEIEASSSPGGGLSIAVLGALEGGHVEAGAFRADLDRDGVDETFRECASGEGLHLTAWSGTAPMAVRRWHRYVYLGYDLEANCTEEEVGNP
jgi:predicted small lipoprotein YifL